MEEKFSARRIFGETIHKLGSKYKNLIILEADLNNSLYTLNFAKIFPDRHFTVGYAENLAIAMAAGMSVRGKLPLVCGPAASLIGKGWEQIRNSICYPNLNIKIIGSNAGLSNNEEGPLTQALQDLALTRCLPNLKIIAPADAMETKLALEVLLNDFGPTYLRLPHEPTVNIYGNEYQFTLGTANIVKNGEDICIFTNGIMVAESIEAAVELEKRGISVRIVNVSTLAPFDHKTINKCATECKMLVSIEDHSIDGGLKSAILESFNKHTPKKLYALGVQGFGESGKFRDILRKHQLDAKGIYEQIRNWWTEE